MAGNRPHSLVAVFALLAGGCALVETRLCEDWCAYYIDCTDESLDEQGCEFEAGKSGVSRRCLKRCEEVEERLDDDQRQAIEDCFGCAANLERKCDGEEVAELCDLPCDTVDQTRDEFFITFFEDFAPIIVGHPVCANETIESVD